MPNQLISLIKKKQHYILLPLPSEADGRESGSGSLYLNEAPILSSNA